MDDNHEDDQATETLTQLLERMSKEPPEITAAYTRGFQDGFRQGVGKVFILYADDPCTWPGFREWERRIEEWRRRPSLEPPYPPTAGQPGSQSDADEFDSDGEPDA